MRIWHRLHPGRDPLVRIYAGRAAWAAKQQATRHQATGAIAGEPVQVWLNDRGDLVPPVTETDATAVGVGVGTAGWLLAGYGSRRAPADRPRAVRPLPGHLGHWEPSVNGDWRGIVNYAIPYADAFSRRRPGSCLCK